MIRINLLGVPRPKKGKRGGGGGGAMPTMSGDGPGAVIFMVLGLVLGLGAAGYLFYSTNKEATRLATEIEAANRESARLLTVKQKFEQRTKEAVAFERRVKVIDELRAQQSGPVNLLNTVGDMVNNTDAVWLNDMNESGSNININGVALTTNAVANLMTNLKRSGYFKNVEIRIAAQDPAVKDMTNFNFTLICEKMPKTT
ncbi:MAG TPA: PilN domain-containing protein [Terriglobales bacterium]|nr:PilN domain-containing protein [Terriglobales bacterium]